MKFRGIAAAVAVAAAAACTGTTDTPDDAGQTPDVEPTPAAVTYIADDWESTLGGDSLGSDIAADEIFAAVAGLADDPTLGGDAAALENAAAEIVTAEVTGVGRDTYAGYWPDGNGTRAGTLLDTVERCADITVHATSARAVPALNGAATVAKVLVVWSANGCPTPPSPAELGDASVSFVYFAAAAGAWQPVRPGPLQSPAPSDGGVLPEWALDPVEGCAGGIVARLEVAYAATQMCADATEAGVTVELSAGFRDADDQAALYSDAVERYGADAAARYVAAAGPGFCDSRHCAGEAIDVSPTAAALAWLSATVGCADLNGTVTLERQDCTGSERAIRRFERYGFTAPLPSNPWHLEFAVPLDEIVEPDAPPTSTCHPSRSAATGQVIADVWRCRLAEAGVVAGDADEIVARALVVSRCASGWSPSAVAFGGAYLDETHPAYGAPYQRFGLFQLSPGWFRAFAPPAASMFDATQNADVAVQLFLAERAFGRGGWDVFPCAAGNDGVYASSVLPELGGPELPGWAYEY